jgi:hypothetical protein
MSHRSMRRHFPTVIAGLLGLGVWLAFIFPKLAYTASRRFAGASAGDPADMVFQEIALYGAFFAITVAIASLTLAFTAWFGHRVSMGQRIFFVLFGWVLPIGALALYSIASAVQTRAFLAAHGVTDRYAPGYFTGLSAFTPLIAALLLTGAPLVFRGRGIYLSFCDVWNRFKA